MRLFWCKLRVTIVKIDNTNIVLDQRRPNLEQLRTIDTCIVSTYPSWCGVNLTFLNDRFEGCTNPRKTSNMASEVGKQKAPWRTIASTLSKRSNLSSLGQDCVEQMDALAAGNQKLRVLYKEVAESNTSGWTARANLFSCSASVVKCVSVPLTEFCVAPGAIFFWVGAWS